mmetsp:Transcript_43140/g.63995  ORF Transcript_43140/g.63995 Transcript_43140/m.63995 type:complete len:116 (-) Transcript_43140:341-688(-)
MHLKATVIHFSNMIVSDSSRLLHAGRMQKSLDGFVHGVGRLGRVTLNCEECTTVFFATVASANEYAKKEATCRTATRPFNFFTRQCIEGDLGEQTHRLRPAVWWVRMPPFDRNMN